MFKLIYSIIDQLNLTKLLILHIFSLFLAQPLCLALTELLIIRPKNPIMYLAIWLRNYSMDSSKFDWVIHSGWINITLQSLNVLFIHWCVLNLLHVMPVECFFKPVENKHRNLSKSICFLSYYSLSTFYT